MRRGRRVTAQSSPGGGVKCVKRKPWGIAPATGGSGGAAWVGSEKGGGSVGDRKVGGGWEGVCGRGGCGGCGGGVRVGYVSRRWLGAILMWSPSRSAMESAAASVRVKHHYRRTSRFQLNAVLMKPLSRSRSEMPPAPVDVRFDHTSRRCLGVGVLKLPWTRLGPPWSWQQLPASSHKGHIPCAIL
jgi:hypothetical protein